MSAGELYKILANNLKRMLLTSCSLVHAGYKVGVVRQTETAALKAAGENKGGPFRRELKHLYTKGTFVDEMATSELDEESPTSSTSYLLCAVEEKRGGGGSDERVRIGLVVWHRRRLLQRWEC